MILNEYVLLTAVAGLVVALCFAIHSMTKVLLDGRRSTSKHDRMAYDMVARLIEKREVSPEAAMRVHAQERAHQATLDEKLDEKLVEAGRRHAARAAGARIEDPDNSVGPYDQG